ncbi:hypothetical protein SAMN04488550_0935 [Gordonia malaquae]|nr:hypothetical protein SAMN04488550_0935 [Gordonia malaquae]
MAASKYLRRTPKACGALDDYILKSLLYAVQLAERIKCALKSEDLL